MVDQGRCRKKHYHSLSRRSLVDSEIELCQSFVPRVRKPGRRGVRMVGLLMIHSMKPNAFLRKQVRHRIKLCIAIEERKQIQRREHLFKSKSHLRFRIPPKREKSRCTRLRVGGALVSDQSQLLEVWTNHFQSLARSQVNFECFKSVVIVVVLIHLS